MTGSREYALVSPTNEIVKLAWFEEGSIPPELAPNKGRFLPVVNVEVLYGPDTTALIGPLLRVEPGRVTRGYDLRDKTPQELALNVKAKMEEISQQFNLRTRAPITLPTQLAGDQQFDADDVARSRVMAVLLMIVVAKAFQMPFPDTRPWTPYGSLTPVSLTPRDFVNLLLAVADREDKLFRRKKTLEANLIGVVNDAAQVSAFNAALGWE